MIEAAQTPAAHKHAHRKSWGLGSEKYLITLPSKIGWMIWRTASYNIK